MRAVERLRALRAGRRWTQAEMASRAGMSASRVANLESHRAAGVSVDELVALARVLEVDPVVLYQDTIPVWSLL